MLVYILSTLYILHFSNETGGGWELDDQDGCEGHTHADRQQAKAVLLQGTY